MWLLHNFPLASQGSLKRIVLDPFEPQLLAVGVDDTVEVLDSCYFPPGIWRKPELLHFFHHRIKRVVTIVNKDSIYDLEQHHVHEVPFVFSLTSDLVDDEEDLEWYSLRARLAEETQNDPVVES